QSTLAPPSPTLFPYTTLFRSRTRKPRMFFDRADQPVCGAERSAVQPLATRQIEIGFVNRNHFHRGREFVKELAQPLGIISVSLRSEEHTSELQSRVDLVCRLL